MNENQLFNKTILYAFIVLVVYFTLAYFMKWWPFQSSASSRLSIDCPEGTECKEGEQFMVAEIQKTSSGVPIERVPRKK